MSKRKLLLADDSITIQKVVNLTFADEGIEVISVGDGDSALRKFDEFIPDLVMADVNMPGKSGYEVCRLIKQTEETRDIPVILLVGSFEPFDEAEAKDAGADDFLTKPFQSIRQLVNKVTDLLNKKAMVTEEPASETPSAPAENAGFEETVSFEPAGEPAKEAEPRQEISAEFGDAGMDDEMIEASPADEYVSGSESAYPADTAEDYSRTQPLTAEDLQEFGTGEQETREPFEYREGAAESSAESPRAEAATFDEEARKLEDYPAYYETSVEDRPEISETEPQVDYYLPAESEEQPATAREFEKEVTDAETLEPDVSYAKEENREADLSEAPAEETREPAEEDEEAPAVEETPPSDTGFIEAQTVEERFEDFEPVPTQETAETGDLEQAETASETPFTVAAKIPSISFDEGDLLELPPLVEETGIRPQPKAEALTPEIVTDQAAEPESKITVTKKESEIALSFPPELIEAIAQKVADKISAKTMSEVLPRITELVMKQLEEEKKE